MRRLGPGHDSTLTFTFDGVTYTGRPGDTLASALLANDVTRVATSVSLGRPRGVVTAGVDEPSALVRISAPFVAAMTTATTVELVDGLVAHGVAGRGTLSATPDDTRYDAMHVHCEVLVVGAGPAGLAAALTAARAGVRTVLVDDRPEAGGELLDPSLSDWARATAAELAAAPHVRVLSRTTAFGTYDDGLVLAVQGRTDHLGAAAPSDAVRQRIWRIRTAQTIVATGAFERPIAFAGNDRPGVLLAGAARTYLHRHGVLVGDRVVVFTTNDSGYDAAHDLVAAGAQVTVVDPRPASPRAAGLDVRFGTVVAAVRGDDRVTVVCLAARDGADAGALDCDAVLVSGGWNPTSHLYSQAGGKLAWDATLGALVPSTDVPGVRTAGAAAGVFDLGGCLAGGADAAAHCLAELDVSAGQIDLPEVAAAASGAPSLTLWSVPLPSDVEVDTRFVDLQRDATVADVLRATGAGLQSVEHIKRYTTIGTAHDQGKTSGILSSGVVAEALGRDMAEVGTTTFRPPYTPVSFAALAGRNRGELFDPVRTTALHAWHVAHGAVFENVGQWHRPQYYPAPGEDADAAVLRETTAARTGVGMMDASTLGKIDVRGADAGEFLDRIYTNMMSSLKPGFVRYGVMCGMDGMILDDGTVMRIGEQEFVLTTTTGNAAAILEWLEEFLQTEWPELDVWLTSVTEHWATAAVVGPRSRDVLAAVAPDLDVTQEAFGFMTWRTALVAGVEARVCRISFSGELAYEVNVPWWHAPTVWAALMAAGEPYGITPYGTDAMHVLRAEKGYPIIGQDTDGTVTPHDLGLSWAVSKKKPDFVGRRSFARAENQRPDRKQLVGLLPTDPAVLLEEGGQVLAVDDLQVPVPMLGHVTSSYRSAALGSTFALAMVRSGRERIGQQLTVFSEGRTVAVTVTDAVLYDKEGTRRDG